MPICKRALVIDDAPLVARILVETLEDESYEVRHASTGQDALTLIEEWLPDVILLDLMLPVMDGWAFREAQLKLATPARDVPVIVVSATREFEVRTHELQAAAAISKPFDLDEVIATVDRVVCARMDGGLANAR